MITCVKIVYFIDHLRPDGAQQALRQLVHGLAERGHIQAVVCMDDSWDEALVRSLRQAGAEVRVIGRVPLLAGYGLLATWIWLRQRRFDVAVTMLFIADVFGRALARAAGVPRIVSSIRARNVDYARWKRWAVHLTMRWADDVVINSEAVREFALAVEGAPRERTHYIPNGVCVRENGGAPNSAAVRSAFGLQAGRRLIGGVGRLTYQKGYDVLIEALASQRWSDVDLLLAGVGDAEQALRQQAARLGLEGRVHFAGHRRDVPELLGALDLFVHPARFEGMPNAVLEAMAAGCPIVASAVDGITELIVDGVHGWLVPPDDAGALADAIGEALADRAEARRRGDRARQRAAERFSVTATVDAWERVLRAGAR